MATLVITKNYTTGAVLTKAHLDDAFDSVSTFMNTTKVNSDNIQTGGIATANYAALSVDAAALATSAVTTTKINDLAVTGAKIAANTIAAGKLEGTVLLSGVSNFSLSPSVASSALTVAFKDGTGAALSSSSPMVVAFRNATAATGTNTSVSASSVTDIVVPNTATLGHASGVATYIYVYAINNAGTIIPGVSTALFDDGTLQSSTAVSTSADSATVLYTTGAVTDKAVRLIGRLKSSQAAAGVWDTAISEVAISHFDTTSSSFIGTSQTFNSSSTYNPPAGARVVHVLVVGGGGGGGGAGGAGQPGGNGGWGNAGLEGIYLVTAPQTVTVGAGGAASAGQNTGGIGGTSSFGSLLTCYGAKGGLAGNPIAGQNLFGGFTGGSEGGWGGPAGVSGSTGGGSRAAGGAGGAQAAGEGGGGGGGGGYGVGGTGGAGNANGGAASANTGGGGGGCGATGAGGTSGAGGSGIVIVTVIG